MKYPEPTVSAVIINNNEQVLLCKSGKWNDKYVIPGGHIELGEKIEAALKREVMEETGLTINKIEFLGLQEFINSESFTEDKHFISLDFLCRTEQTKVHLNNEADEYVWADVNNVLEYDLGGYTRFLFNEYLKKEKSEYRVPVFYNYVKELK